MEDHIAPWKTTYAGTSILGGPSRFVLSGSGHIAGMINPPAAKKYGYWTNEKHAATPDEWFDGAKQHDGSWWADWQSWVAERAGREVAPRIPGKGKLKALADAPGTYVRVRADGK